ncbi:hypothetical protein SAMN04487773_2666 [Enterobacter sp. kpr-6]|uniref:hypothetical protein n=1 Tax=Enterobacter sp. kpr-6 TaxID=1761782 RepID=UPI0008E04BA5|nr:hypothetical protein [Enterobacter sp. kpr-6]SFR09841.1 hypothetical protein SAMN04487773_2666 [Enterobacter sp. kpr-6]
MGNYYLGGYLLLHCLPGNYPDSPLDGKPLLTCSTCFNDSLLDDWSYCWSGFDKNDPYDAWVTIREHLASAYSLDDITWERLSGWVNEKYETGNVGWPALFMDAATAIEYKQTFFPQLNDCYLLALYIDGNDAQRFIDSWRPQNDMEGMPGIYRKLSAFQPEQALSDEKLLGYDIGGLDIDGGFHTSHCHSSLHDELCQRFALTLNSHGLYDALDDWQPVVDYMNNDKTVCEPVPWGIVKIKQVIF